MHHASNLIALVETHLLALRCARPHCRGQAGEKARGWTLETGFLRGRKPDLAGGTLEAVRVDFALRGGAQGPDRHNSRVLILPETLPVQRDFLRNAC